MSDEMAFATLDAARTMFLDNVEAISLDEALDAAGGYRSILGLIKHTAGWSEVYRSFAFEPRPRGWTGIAWPVGLRETIEATEAYLADVIAWFDRSSSAWLETVRGGVDLDRPTRVHWGETWPLRDVIAYVAAHWSYHAGEINEILAIRRREAWEFGEHVEENHIATVGHSVRRPWITDEQVERDEADMRRAAGRT